MFHSEAHASPVFIQLQPNVLCALQTPAPCSSHVPFTHCSLLPAPFPISCREACQTYYLTSALNPLRGQDNQHKKNYFLIFQFLRICFLPLHQQTNAQHRADTSTSILFPLPVLAQQDGLHLLISLCISILLRRTDVPHLCVPPTKTTPLCTSPYPHFHALLPAVFLTIFAPLSWLPSNSGPLCPLHKFSVLLKLHHTTNAAFHLVGHRTTRSLIALAGFVPHEPNKP